MDHSPLRHLSGELRNIIYDYLWPGQGEVIICLCGSHHPLRSHLRNPKADEAWTYAGSHLPKVCRQLRRETLGYFYGVNSFVLPLHYVLQAGDQTRLEAQWHRFVRVFGVEMVRQIKHMTVLAGQINEISAAESPRFELVTDVDEACVFAGRSIRPCLHPAARMLVLIEHHSPGRETRSWIDFDDPLGTADRLEKAVKAAVAADPYSLSDWDQHWPSLLHKWNVRVGVVEDWPDEIDDASSVEYDSIV